METALKLQLLLILLTLCEPFELQEDDWDHLNPELAALHRLRGLSEHMIEHRLTMDHSQYQSSARTVSLRLNRDVDLMKLHETLQRCDNLTSCITDMQQDFEGLLETIDKKKVQDWLIAASEVSHSYSQKLLLMTDDNQSTKDQVQEEYSVDPQYSVIVTTGCLNNVSCLPEVDSHTVVKVFGQASADGQSVSGFSGSSLADLIIKPELEMAAVVSLNGNTTTEFQHHFIHTFMRRGLQTVIETRQENNQIYQVMTGPGSVSSYRSPVRAVDHSTQYDHQQILLLQNDPVVKKAAISLYVKHPKVSSVYILDQNQRPKLIHGEPTPLSQNSRLVLVGHGSRDSSGETKLSGYTSRELSDIVQKTSRDGNKIKTTSVVGCEVGSDTGFIKNLMRELRKTGIETQLNLRDAVLQVLHTGEKVTQKLTPDGIKWMHKDSSKKVEAAFDKNGEIIIRTGNAREGKAIFTNERDVLGGGMNKNQQKKTTTNQGKKNKNQIDSGHNRLPTEPRLFVDLEVIKDWLPNIKTMKSSYLELESLTGAMFPPDLPEPKTVSLINEQSDQQKLKYLIVDKREKGWKFIDNQQLENVLKNCYEVNTGDDMRNVIQHFAKTDQGVKYLMVNDWIFKIGNDLYVHPVGKRVNMEEKAMLTKYINDDLSPSKETYGYMKSQIKNKQEYVNFVRKRFCGEKMDLSLKTSGDYTKYFTASIISESIRNFRQFTLTLMALDIGNNKFFLDNNPMARGGSLINPGKKGFEGVTAPKLPGKEGKYQMVIEKEYELLSKWLNFDDQEGILNRMKGISEKFKVSLVDSKGQNKFEKDYKNFKQMSEKIPPPASGSLGGYEDGHITPWDLDSALDLEKSFKHESYFSRASASFADEIQVKLKAKYGGRLEGLTFKEGTSRIEDGKFVCELVSKSTKADPVEFRTKLSSKSQKYVERLQGNLDGAVREMETFALKPQKSNKRLERIGNAMAVLGLMTGLRGLAQAFEHGSVTQQVMGTLQTAHGVTSMTTSALAKKVLSVEVRATKAATSTLKSSVKRVLKGATKALPLIGIGFEIYSIVEDIKRNTTLGYIDAAFDGVLLVLDVLELVPVLTPFVAPVNLALSIIRMVFDDIYMAIENELNSLPADARVLQKIGAVFIGLGKGLLNFLIAVANIFYDWRQQEIDEGRRLVAQISDQSKYYKISKDADGKTSIDFNAGSASWNGGGIDFCLADQGLSRLCMDYFVSSDESIGKRCWDIDAQGSTDITLGLGESHGLQYSTYQKKVLLVIPAGSVTVVSGYEAKKQSRYGTYRGNRESNRFFAAQTSEKQEVYELILSYYYRLYGESGDDMFFLGPQRSYVEGSGGRDTYILSKNGGNTYINNYDAAKAQDTLHFNVDFSQISASKSGDNVVLTYGSSYTVMIHNWFLGEVYRHMTIISNDGVLFDISSTVLTSVHLEAVGINLMFKDKGVTVNTAQRLLQTVTNIIGSPFDDVLIGNKENNLMDGGGGTDRLIGGEGEDVYALNGKSKTTVMIENHSVDNKTDLLIVEANFETFSAAANFDDLILRASHTYHFHVTLVNWFQSSADRHLLVVTKDFVTFSISEVKADCRPGNRGGTCIKPHRVDYSRSQSPLNLDLQEDKTLNSVTEITGSHLNDEIKGNQQPNVIIPGTGDDYMEGREGEDWYVITPGQGVKTINNLSPDTHVDSVFVKDQFEQISSFCEGPSIVLLVRSRRTVLLKDWFVSKSHQHLLIKTSDGITAKLAPNSTSCGGKLLLPLTVDYRNQNPEALGLAHPERQKRSSAYDSCYKYRNAQSEEISFCSERGKVMLLKHEESVRDMHGSSGFDIMVGNSQDNQLDPFTGGALMSGGEGKDTYIIKHGYGSKLVIDNFAEDATIDTLTVDMDFLDGAQVKLYPNQSDLKVTIKSMEETLSINLFRYTWGHHYQHLEFQSSDGVHFRIKEVNPAKETSPYLLEAFKVILKPSHVDCRLDLSSMTNLSEVVTVQGCPTDSNYILGNDQDNVLSGGWKNDVLDGDLGDDTLIGGQGADMLIGGMGDDTLYGEDGNDTLIGTFGKDVFVPGPGADIMDGGPGRDTVLYRGDHQRGEGVYIDLLTGQGHRADAEGDVLKDIEIVIGTIYPDILVSGSESALLKGSDGSDLLVSTGEDYLVGGEGNDVYLLAFNNGTVTIDNCAEDNQKDVLYLRLESTPIFDCQTFSHGVVFTFFGLETKTEVLLKDWSSDDSECGHLAFVFGDVEATVQMMLHDCELRKQEYWSSFLKVFCIIVGLVVVHSVVVLLLLQKCKKKQQRRVAQKRLACNFEESITMSNVECDVSM